MAEDRSSTKSSPTDPSVPPPPDPFPTYQAPYPQSRSSPHEPNPFVLFRQFADSQLSSIFDKVPALLRSTFGLSEPLLPTTSSETTQHCIENALDMLRDPTKDNREIMQKIETCRGQGDERHNKRIDQELEESRMQTVEPWWNAMTALKDVPFGSATHADEELSLYDRFLKNGPDRTNSNMFGAYASSGSPPPTDLFQDYVKGGVATIDPAVDEPHALLWWVQNPYSPLKLKQQHESSSFGPPMAKLLDWELAFRELISGEASDEDGVDARQKGTHAWNRNLLNSYEAAKLARGVSMPAHGTRYNKKDASREWMEKLDLALVNAWPTVWDDISPKESETGIYDAFRKLSSDRTLSRLYEDSGRPEDVVTQSISINRKQLPDGSIETRKIRKVVYRNGREDSSEIVKHHPSPPRAFVKNPEKTTLQAEQKPPQSLTKTNKIERSSQSFGKGWFWN